MYGDFILSIPAIPAIAVGQDDSLGRMVNDFHGDPLGKITILLKLSLYEVWRAEAQNLTLSNMLHTLLHNLYRTSK